MAIATNQSILRGNIGKMGDIFMRTVNGKTVISKAPKCRTKKSEREIANHSLFQQAAAFAVEAMRDPGLKLHFKNVAKRRKLPNGYTAALSLKLRALRARLKEQVEKESTALIARSVGTPACVHSANHFTRICRDTENTIGDALLTLSMAWRNIERPEFDEKRKEVSRIIVRAQIRQWLIDLT